jgi:predicted Na+-dependent transporter
MFYWGVGRRGPAVWRGFSLGIVILPFLVFLALNALWTPASQVGWVVEVGASVVGGLGLGVLLNRAFHKLFDARLPTD